MREVLGVIANTDNPLYMQTVSSTGVNPEESPKPPKETDRQRRRRKKKAKIKAKRFLLGLEVTKP